MNLRYILGRAGSEKTILIYNETLHKLRANVIEKIALKEDDKDA